VLVSKHACVLGLGGELACGRSHSHGKCGAGAFQGSVQVEMQGGKLGREYAKDSTHAGKFLQPTPALIPELASFTPGPPAEVAGTRATAPLPSIPWSTSCRPSSVRRELGVRAAPLARKHGGHGAPSATANKDGNSAGEDQDFRNTRIRPGWKGMQGERGRRLGAQDQVARHGAAVDRSGRGNSCGWLTRVNLGAQQLPQPERAAQDCRLCHIVAAARLLRRLR
jgi:hypothetical protein